jgi:hypothetical protein
LAELTERLNSAGSLSQLVFGGIRGLLEVRTQQSAFHPAAEQHYHESNSDQVLCFERVSRQTGEAIFVAANFGEGVSVIELPAQYCQAEDLLDSTAALREGQADHGPLGDGALEASEIALAPAQIVWLKARK